MGDTRSWTEQGLDETIDGGAFDWLRTLGANDKLVFVASGFGSQLAAFACRRAAPA